MFKKQESLLNDVVGGAAIGIAVGMIMEKVLSPRTPIANSSTYGMHSPVQWQSGCNQLQYVPSPHHCHRIYPSPCKHYKQKHCSNGVHSEYEDSSIDDNMSSLQSSRIYDTSTGEYTSSSKVTHIPYDSTQSTSFKTRTSNTVASNKMTKDNLTTPDKRTTLPKKQDSSQSKTDASKKQSIKDKSVESKSNVSKKEIIKKDLTIPAYKQKVNTVNKPSVKNCTCSTRKIDEALTDLPKKYKMPLFEISSKSKPVHCSKTESADIKSKVSARSQGVKESVNTSKVVKALADLSTETSKSETLIKSSKDKTVTEKSKYHGIKSESSNLKSETSKLETLIKSSKDKTVTEKSKYHGIKSESSNLKSETSKSETLIKSSKDKTVTEKSKYHGIKSESSNLKSEISKSETLIKSSKDKIVTEKSKYHGIKSESSNLKSETSKSEALIKSSKDKTVTEKSKYHGIKSESSNLKSETSKSEALIKSSKDKTVTEKSKYHGIKSSTILDASSFSQTKDLQSLSETGNLATYHPTKYIDLDITKTETSCLNTQNEKENIRDLLEFW